jgi:Cation transporter/ATPase, N-terminus
MRPTTIASILNRRIGTERPWTLPAGRVAADLGADPVAGLPEAEAAGRLAQFGENVLVEQVASPPGGGWPSSSPTR